jgi:hypothetical protein
MRNEGERKKETIVEKKLAATTTKNSKASEQWLKGDVTMTQTS